MSTAPEEEPRRIGVVHLNQVGDLLFSLPALAALRAGFPQARIASIESALGIEAEVEPEVEPEGEEE